MQGYVDAGVQEADRQSEDEPPSMAPHSLLFVDRIDGVASANQGSALQQGVYVLTDNTFKPFSRMSMASPSEAVHRAQPVESKAPWIRYC